MYFFHIFILHVCILLLFCYVYLCIHSIPYLCIYFTIHIHIRFKGPDGGPAALKESSHMYFPSLSMPPSTYSFVLRCTVP